MDILRPISVLSAILALAAFSACLPAEPAGKEAGKPGPTIVAAPVPVTVSPLTVKPVQTTPSSSGYRLFVADSPHGSGKVEISPARAIYEPGTQLMLTAKPASGGYKFRSWGLDAQGTNPTIAVTMDSDKHISANFDAAKYKLWREVAPVTGAGTITVSPLTELYDFGAEVTLTANPTQCYQFETWGGAVTDTNRTIKVKMNKDVDIIAGFSRIKYTVTVGVSEGLGTVKRIPAQDTYVCGEVLTLEAQPDGLYKFISWGGDAKGTEREIKITVDKDINVTAAFERLKRW